MKSLQLRKTNKLSRRIFFFILGSAVTLLTLIIFFYGTLFLRYQNRVFPGVLAERLDLTGLTPAEAEKIIDYKFNLAPSKWRLVFKDQLWELDGQDIGIRVDSKKMAQEAYSLGRQPNLYYSMQQIWNAYRLGRNIPLLFDWEENNKKRLFSQFRELADVKSREAQFKFEPGIGPDGKGRVVAFVQSQTGTELDEHNLELLISNSARKYLLGNKKKIIELELPVKLVQPNISSDQANQLGIVEILGRGESYFYDSIPGRVHNISQGTEKINGSLLAPGEVFSFNQAIGTVSAVFGFQKAYSIIQGKTVLDDGGGVCQVSTTLYRAALNSGLPVIERVGHSYRVSFYEQGGFLPGLDATVYPPSPDFKFKNDTGSWILIQANFDQVNQKLTFELYGKNDSRITEVSKPIILSTSPPPDPVYEDDPNLPEGTIKRIDTAHYGANVYFTRIVSRNGEILIDEKVSTSFIPWPARYLRGTKPN